MKTSLLLILLGLSLGCASFGPPEKDPSITVNSFDCSDPMLANFVQRIVQEQLRQNTSSDVILNGEAPIKLSGMVLHQSVSSRRGSGSRGKSVTADVVEGISITISSNGKEISSVTWVQDLGKGEMLSPGEMSEIIAGKTLKKLRKLRLVSKRGFF